MEKNRNQQKRRREVHSGSDFDSFQKNRSALLEIKQQTLGFEQVKTRGITMSGIKKILFLLFAGNLLLSADTFQENRNGSITLDYQTGKNSNEFHALGQTMEMFQFC